MPDAESARLRAAFVAAEVILEFGSGGSTVLAAEMPGKCIFSVESDKAWLRMMQEWFADNPVADQTELHLVHADIGPTGAWGHPKDDRAWRRFAHYPLGVWRHTAFRHPDVVFVDGRFRVGCALATALHISRPVTLLFDDYANRARLAQVETYLGTPKQMVGRMAEFDVTPLSLRGEQLIDIIKFMSQP